MLYKVNDKLYIRPEAVAHIKFHEGLEAYIGTMSGLNLSITEDEGRALLEHINGAAGKPPAADVVAGTKRHVTQVEKFISKSGNESWKAESVDALLYFRQTQREMLQEAGLWDELHEMHVGEVLECSITVYTVPDGDFHKIIRIDPDGAFFDPDDDGDDWEDIEDEPEDVPMLGLDPDDDPDDDFASLRLPETNDKPDDPFFALIRSGNFVILDTETTGLDDKAEICQIAIIDATGKTLLDTLVKPTLTIPTQATRIHGITNDMVKTAPNFINVAQAVWDAIEGKTVVVYNADYDFRLLRQSEDACEPFAKSDWHTIKRQCAMLKFAEIYGDWDSYHNSYRWKRLEEAARHYLLPVLNAHTALGDCLMTLAVCNAMLNAQK